MQPPRKTHDFSLSCMRDKADSRRTIVHNRPNQCCAQFTDELALLPCLSNLGAQEFRSRKTVCAGLLACFRDSPAFWHSADCSQARYLCRPTGRRSTMTLRGIGANANETILTRSIDLIPCFRTNLSMISDEGKRYVEEQAQGSADDRGAE